jgi:hypothetical protein
MIRHPKLHGGGDAQGFMDAAKIVMRDIQRDGGALVQLDLGV